jgi:hypothetical protein
MADKEAIEGKDDKGKDDIGPILRFIFAQVLVVGLVGLFIIVLRQSGGIGNEGIFALVLVLAVVFLMTTLFILASGFSHLQLTDLNQPLGLPGGSVRAMIALILILVFIMFGAYLYTQELTYAEPGYGPIEMSRDQYLGLPNVISAEPLEGTDRYLVYFANPDVRNSSRLAQQLLTTVGTLVVAVAGFYFGSAVAGGSGGAGNGTRSVVPGTGSSPTGPGTGSSPTGPGTGSSPTGPGTGLSP